MKVTATTKLFARKALKYIEQHPEQHSQERWFSGVPGHCNTTMCVAGTVAFLKYGPGAQIVSAERQARSLLGLSLGESDSLFFEMDKERAKAKLAKIANGEPFDRADFFRAAEDGAKPAWNDNSWTDRELYTDGEIDE